MLARRTRVPAETMKDLRGLMRRASPFFVVRSGKNGLAHPRLAVTVGLKVDRRSSERHKLRRRVAGYLVREVRSGNDVVVAVLPPAANLPLREFYKELGKVLDK